MIDLNTIITFVVGIVTYVFGELSKKYHWVDKKYIIIQDIIIGIISAMLYYLLIDNSSVKNAIVIVLGALGSAGIYDLTKVAKTDERENNGR